MVISVAMYKKIRSAAFHRNFFGTFGIASLRLPWSIRSEYQIPGITWYKPLEIASNF